MRSMTSYSRQQGFTLIEIIIVVTIIGIIVGGVSVFITNDDPVRLAKKDIEKFLTFADHASDTAVIGGETVGLVLDPPAWREGIEDPGWAYKWQKNTIQGWVDIEAIPTVEISRNIELIVLLNDQEWEWDKSQIPEIRIPIAAFYPSGEVSPFEIQFIEVNGAIDVQHVLVDLWGSVVWKEQQEELEEAERNF